MGSNGYKPAPRHAELTSDKLRWRCETSRLPFETTAQAELREGFIGQERALRALKMGVELSAPGYNVFVCGLAGTSRGGTIARMIEELHPKTKPSLDRCYVNNFKITDRPRLLSLPRGQANGFRKDMQAGIDFLRRRIPQVFEGEPFQRQKGRIVERFTVREKELMDDFTRRIARDQFALGHSKMERHNLVETRIREMIEEGTLLVDVAGMHTGQVNGLSVLEIGGYSFGKPVRITATAALGKAGVINIERESNLSGRFHDKGVHIISGYLRSRFAQDKPLSLAASICFEQSYSGVDGDSASSTEVYALVSALAELPLRQDIAVTGSMNQKGEVQAIGGVNEKIEGFFDVCRITGLTGTQGVIMPAANVEDLMLREDVVEAVAAGKFHIWPVAKVEEGIEILSGMTAGQRNGDGTFETGSVFARMDERLGKMARMMKEFE